MGDRPGQAYCELKRGLEIYSSGNTELVLVFWHMGFQNEWGIGLAEGLSVMHGMPYAQ